MIRTLRCFAGLALLACLVSCVSSSGHAAEDPISIQLNHELFNGLSDTLSLGRMERRINRFMRRWGLHGAQLSVVRNDSLLYTKGFGMADSEKGEAMTPGHVMRIASISKLVTAAGVMKLSEEGLLNLDDLVFGPGGILRDSFYCNSIKDPGYYKITVEHLLRHQGGFGTRLGDPMFSTRAVMQRNGLEKAPDHRTMLRCELRRRLAFVPGTSQSYSNLGYMILSMVIEQKSGRSYEDFIRDEVLAPAGCHDFRIAGNYLKDRQKGEVRYYVPDNEPLYPEYNCSGDSVVRCYGANDIKSLAGAGAWVASTAELARFVASIDGRPGVPDILKPESVGLMTEYFDSQTYSLGWNDTNPEIGWTRSGTFSGTSALIKYFPDGECWIFLTNTSTWKGPGLARYTSAMFSECRREWGGCFKKQNLFRVRQ